MDMVFYGLWISTLCLGAFSLAVFGFGSGSLGSNCNDKYSPECDTVYRGRATLFACLTWFALFLALEMLDMRRSLFRLTPKSKKYFTQWAVDIYKNKFLFWAVMVGWVTMFFVLYTPKVNTIGFKHIGITWEWGIVFVMSLLFFLGVETWKFGKRIFFRRRERRFRQKQAEDPAFQAAQAGNTSPTRTNGSGSSHDGDAAEKC